MRYTVEAGRGLVAEDGERKFYIGPVETPRGYAMPPAHLDQLTHKIAALLNGDATYTYCDRVYPVDAEIGARP